MNLARLSLRRTDYWLAGIAASSLLVAAIELLWPHPLAKPADSPEELHGEDGLAPPEIAARRLGPLSAYQLIADKPLFAPDRLPYEPPIEEAHGSLEPHSELEVELSAIVVTEAARLALLKVGTSPELRKIGIGQAVEGWILTDVRPDEIVLQQGSESRTVKLQSQSDTEGQAHRPARRP